MEMKRPNYVKGQCVIKADEKSTTIGWGESSSPPPAILTAPGKPIYAALRGFILSVVKTPASAGGGRFKSPSARWMLKTEILTQCPVFIMAFDI